ncbi:MAG: hypothetical protein R2710_05255 [Acidimicrobiales bacterium]
MGQVNSRAPGVAKREIGEHGESAMPMPAAALLTAAITGFGRSEVTGEGMIEDRLDAVAGRGLVADESSVVAASA